MAIPILLLGKTFRLSCSIQVLNCFINGAFCFNRSSCLRAKSSSALALMSFSLVYISPNMVRAYLALLGSLSYVSKNFLLACTKQPIRVMPCFTLIFLRKITDGNPVEKEH